MEMDDNVKKGGRWMPFRNPLKTCGLNDTGEAFRNRGIVSPLVRESIPAGE